MSEFRNIDEGTTYDYLAQGLLVLLVVGIAGIFTHPIISLIGLVGGIGLMAVKSGVQINVENRSIRKYSSFFGYKVGEWKNLRNVVSGKLEYHKESGDKGVGGRAVAMPQQSLAGVRSSVKCYIMKFRDDKGRQFEFHSFVKQKPAFQVIQILETELDIPIDNVLLKMQKVLGKNRRR